MVNTHRRDLLQLRLFIEGEEIPCISATVTHTMQGPSTAYVQVVGTNAARYLKEKSIVEVYVRKEGGLTRTLDKGINLPFYTYDQENDSVSKRLIRVTKQRTSITLGDKSIPIQEAEEWLNYDLLFFGELIGFTGFTDAQSRTVNLLCSDMTNNLDYINLFNADGANLMYQSALLRQQRFSGVNFGDSDIAKMPSANDILASEEIDFTGSGVTSGPGEVKSNLSSMVVSGVIGLEQKLDQILAKYGLTEGLQRIFQVIADSYSYYRDINEEFNLRDQIYIAPDTYTQKVFQHNQRINYLRGILARMSPVNSVRNLIKIIFRLTRFEFMTLPGSPFYLPLDPDTEERIPAPKVAVIRPELFFSDPPACNIIFPDEVYTYNTSRQYMSEITRQIDFTDHVLYAQNDGSILNWSAIAPTVEIGPNGELKSLYPQSMPVVTSSTQEELTAFSKVLLPEEIFKGILTLTSSTSHELRAAATLGDKESDDLLTSDTINLSNEETAEDPEKQLEATLFYMREVNYKFLRAKFQTRTATASCKFIPRIAVGFPIFLPLRSMEEERSRKSTSIGLIGFCVSVTHVVSQAGGVTSISASHIRELDERVDFFVDPKNFSEDGSISVSPDFRYFVIPWAQEKYGPDNLHRMYGDWLGGLDWKGDRIDESSDKYLGVTTAVDAMIRFGRTGVRDRLNQRGTPLEELRKAHPLHIYLSFFDGYLSIRSKSGPSWELEREFLDFMNRPVANLLQMRGYLNAYMTTRKYLTGSSDGNELASIQTGLQVLGYYSGPISGKDSEEVKAAIKRFKEDAVNRKILSKDRLSIDEFGPEEKAAMEQLLLTSVLSENDLPPKRGSAFTPTGSLVNKLIRRVERKGKVLQYISSIEESFPLISRAASRGLTGI